jgi:hypothetical protein
MGELPLGFAGLKNFETHGCYEIELGRIPRENKAMGGAERGVSGDGK